MQVREGIDPTNPSLEVWDRPQPTGGPKPAIRFGRRNETEEDGIGRTCQSQ